MLLLVLSVVDQGGESWLMKILGETMWPFKKNKKNKKIIFKSEKINVQQTKVVITLLDGRVIAVWVPGTVSQCCGYSNGCKYSSVGPYIDEVLIYKSQNAAQDFILWRMAAGLQNFPDHLDSKLVKEVWQGQPIHAVISMTEDYFVEHKVAYWKDEE